MKKIIALMFVILMFLVGCKPENTDDNIIGENDQKDGVNEEKTGFEGITKQQCMDSYGNWNECGSPCAGTGAEMCAQVCRVQCECSGIAGFGCPEGYKCRLTGKIADEMGVCVKG
ncbi:MAG: hypothetical protein V1831_02955 [Candidatus Woesearchaeota archaeon]